MTTWECRGTVLRVHDGDTPFMDLDLGFDIWRRNIGIRLAVSPSLWINAIELGQPGGAEARDALLSVLPVDSVWTVRSFGWDKYGDRADADIYRPDGSSIATWLVDNGWAVGYNGKGTAPIPPWPRSTS